MSLQKTTDRITLDIVIKIVSILTNPQESIYPLMIVNHFKELTCLITIEKSQVFTYKKERSKNS